jgi:ABC-2 type transport system permease protein
MNKFLTLIRRDMADNRGALIITPLVIAAILLFVTFFASITGHSRFGIDPREFDRAAQLPPGQSQATIDVDGEQVTIRRDGASGHFIITDKDGNTKTLDRAMSPEDKRKAAKILPFGTAIASALPLGVAAIAILFVLAGGLHDERKDRTILFWKSMPVSDLQTVGAKLVSIVGGGFFAAFGIVVVLNLAITIIAVTTLGNLGMGGIDVGAVFMNSANMWLVTFVGLLVYIGWALPVYGWMTMVSSYVNKMPFVAAFAPLIVVPLVYMAIAFRGNENDPILQALWDPISRLIGEPVFTGMKDAISQTHQTTSALPTADILRHLSTSFAQPMFWVGLLVAAGFVYAASEIRRRRAL